MLFVPLEVRRFHGRGIRVLGRAYNAHYDARQIQPNPKLAAMFDDMTQRALFEQIGAARCIPFSRMNNSRHQEKCC